MGVSVAASSDPTPPLTSGGRHEISVSANIILMPIARTLLLEARRASGLKQAELAAKAGIPASVLNAYERGKRQPGAEALASILHAAGFELRLAPVIDLERNACILEQVLDLAEHLPWRPRRRLAAVPFNRRIA